MSLAAPGAEPPRGGRTRVAVNSIFSLESDAATVVPGGALLFRKDLEHEGLPVTAGEKHVLTLNLWASRKAEPGVLVLSFPSAAAAAGGGGSGDSTTQKQQQPAPLQALAAGRSYAVSLSQLRQHPDCIVNTVAELLAEESAAATAPQIRQQRRRSLLLSRSCSITR